MNRNSYTPSGVRRSGDDYQDLVTLDLILDWLEHPERFQSIEVEADDAGALDDVMGTQSDGSVVVRQVKFSAHPEDADDLWSWERLLEQKKGRRQPLLPSLLQRWSTSLRGLLDHEEVTEAALVSNRRADAVIASLLNAQRRIDFDKITDQSLQGQIIDHCGGEREAIQFFPTFEFQVDRPLTPRLLRAGQGVTRRMSP